MLPIIWQSLVRRLQSVLIASARMIFQLRRSHHITDALASLHWLRVPQLQGAKPPDPWPVALPLDPTGGYAPHPLYSLALMRKPWEGIPALLFFHFEPCLGDIGPIESTPWSKPEGLEVRLSFGLTPWSTHWRALPSKVTMLVHGALKRGPILVQTDFLILI